MSGEPGEDWTTRSASGLDLAVTPRPDSPVLEEFFAGYDAAFILPDEKEDLAGFQACLALGQGPVRARLLKRYGLHRELVLTARQAGGREMIGGANFIAYPVARGLVAANLNYVFVTRQARGHGRLRQLVSACEELMAGLFGEPAAATLAFIELNDPFALSDEDYRADTAAAGIDQFDRLSVWSRLGARLVDLDYVQPPLSPAQSADEGLIYAVLGAATQAALDPAMLHAHLERFFAISVLKGGRPELVPPAARQLQALERMAKLGERVRLLDPEPGIAPGKALRAAGKARPSSYREFLKAR